MQTRKLTTLEKEAEDALETMKYRSQWYAYVAMLLVHNRGNPKFALRTVPSPYLEFGEIEGWCARMGYAYRYVHGEDPAEDYALIKLK